MKDIKRLFFWFTVTTMAAAVVKELRRPPEDREWHGEVLGVVPYDFRPPSFSRFRAAWWNSDDERLFTPRDFGVGWAINIPQAIKLVKAQANRNPGTDASQYS